MTITILQAQPLSRLRMDGSSPIPSAIRTMLPSKLK
ncbi:hypothetical protein WJ66_01277 [Stenotrophomonas maltophilia WJ66]|nr:hypothetical protein L681_00670 [Stenotrophomonas maltophilia MF89]KIS40735.1 hypothetical protein WJ66_01277 [Stenotrophomonas maltophilia WJ66]